MSKHNQLSKEVYIDNLIDKIQPEKDLIAPPFFTEKVMARIQSLDNEQQALIPDKYFYRAIAATIAILLLINLITIYSSHTRDDNQSALSSNESVWQTIESDSYNNYSQLAME